MLPIRHHCNPALDNTDFRPDKLLLFDFALFRAGLVGLFSLLGLCLFLFFLLGRFSKAVSRTAGRPRIRVFPGIAWTL
jgi:hypothetical protein